jgi:hypothetical protein
MPIRLINNHRQPITLEDGTILAAASTKGSVREVESLSDGDRRRYVERGRIAILTIDEGSDEPPVATLQEAESGDDLPPPTSIASVIARDVVKAARADLRKKAERDKEEGNQ